MTESKLLEKLVSERAKTFRLNSGWTQEDVAFFLGLSVEEYLYLEDGLYSLTHVHISKLATLYMVDEYSFFDRELTNFKVFPKISEKEDMENLSKFYDIIQNYVKLNRIYNQKMIPLTDEARIALNVTMDKSGKKQTTLKNRK